MRIISILLALCIATALQAQTNASVIVKKGNTFCCGEQQMDRAAYQQYKQGRQCMIAGWALFGGGLAIRF